MIVRDTRRRLEHAHDADDADANGTSTPAFSLPL